jgi:hypothetical protein
MATRASAGRTVQLGDDRGNRDEWPSEPFGHVGRVFRWLIGEGWKRTDAVRIDYCRHPGITPHNMTYGRSCLPAAPFARPHSEALLEPAGEMGKIGETPIEGDVADFARPICRVA